MKISKFMNKDIPVPSVMPIDRRDYTVGGYHMYDLPANGVMQILGGYNE